MEEGRVSFEFRYFKCNRGTGGKKGFGLECLGGYFVARGRARSPVYRILVPAARSQGLRHRPSCVQALLSQGP